MFKYNYQLEYRKMDFQIFLWRNIENQPPANFGKETVKVVGRYGKSLVRCGTWGAGEGGCVAARDTRCICPAGRVASGTVCDLIQLWCKAG